MSILPRLSAFSDGYEKSSSAGWRLSEVKHAMQVLVNKSQENPPWDPTTSPAPDRLSKYTHVRTLPDHVVHTAQLFFSSKIRKPASMSLMDGVAGKRLPAGRETMSCFSAQASFQLPLIPLGTWRPRARTQP